VIMIVASGASYLVNEAFAKARYATAAKMSFEAPLTSLVWVPRSYPVVLTYAASLRHDPRLGDGSLWWKLLQRHHLRHPAGAIYPRVRQGVHSPASATCGRWSPSARERASLGISPASGGQLQRVLAGPDHGAPDEHRYGVEHPRARQPDGRARGVRVPGPRRFGFPGMGGDDRGRLLRSGGPTTPSPCSSCP